MRIVNGKKFYKKDEEEAVRIDGKGWNTYNGRNKQWYSLEYNPNCGLVILSADNSGDCYGDYSTKYFSSPKEFEYYCEDCGKSWEELMGDIDEENEAAIKFVDAIINASKNQQNEK